MNHPNGPLKESLEHLRLSTSRGGGKTEKNHKRFVGQSTGKSGQGKGPKNVGVKIKKIHRSGKNQVFPWDKHIRNWGEKVNHRTNNEFFCGAGPYNSEREVGGKKKVRWQKSTPISNRGQKFHTDKKILAAVCEMCDS